MACSRFVALDRKRMGTALSPQKHVRAEKPGQRNSCFSMPWPFGVAEHASECAHLSVFPLIDGLSDAGDDLELLLECIGHLVAHKLVALPNDLPPLAVSQDDPVHAQVFQLLGSNLELKFQMMKFGGIRSTLSTGH